MNALHPKFPYPTNNEEFIDFIFKLENENLSILSGSSFEPYFQRELMAFNSFNTTFGTTCFSETQWLNLWSAIRSSVLCAIQKKYKHYLESGGEGPVHPVLAEIFDWECALELIGPTPSTSEMKQMLDSCPSSAAPSYFTLLCAHYDQRKEAA